MLKEGKFYFLRCKRHSERLWGIFFYTRFFVQTVSVFFRVRVLKSFTCVSTATCGKEASKSTLKIPSAYELSITHYRITGGKQMAGDVALVAIKYAFIA